MADKYVFRGNALTGGAEGALDSLNGAVVPDGSEATVDTGSIVYFYVFDSGSAAAESVPDVIAPDVGTGRWLLTALNDPSTLLVDSINKRVGINTTPAYLLHAKSALDESIAIETTKLNGYAILRLINDSNSWDISNAGAEGDVLRFYDGSATQMTIAPTTGKLTATGEVLALSGIIPGADSQDSKIDDSTSGTGSTVLYLGINTIDTTVPSDKNLKENDVDLPSIIDRIKQLRVVEFNFKGQPDKHVGLIAQEVRLIFPELVKKYRMTDGKVIEPVEIKEFEAFEIKEIETNDAIETVMEKFIEPTKATENKKTFYLDSEFKVQEKNVKVTKTIENEREVTRIKKNARFDTETGKFFIKEKVPADGVTESEGKYYKDKEVKSIKEFLRITYKDFIPYLIKAIQEIA